MMEANVNQLLSNCHTMIWNAISVYYIEVFFYNGKKLICRKHVIGAAEALFTA